MTEPLPDELRHQVDRARAVLKRCHEAAEASRGTSTELRKIAADGLAKIWQGTENQATPARLAVLMSITEKLLFDVLTVNVRGQARRRQN